MTYYLTSPEGTLRKALRSVKASEEATEFETQELTNAEASEGFQKEKQCWTDISKTLRAPSCLIVDQPDPHTPAATKQ
jgi:hypothetical protein